MRNLPLDPNRTLVHSVRLLNASAWFEISIRSGFPVVTVVSAIGAVTARRTIEPGDTDEMFARATARGIVGDGDEPEWERVTRVVASAVAFLRVQDLAEGVTHGA